MHFVDQTGGQVLTNGGHSTSDPDVALPGSFTRAFKRFMNASSHEVERRAAFHRQRLAGMMCQHKNWNMIRRLLAPPSLPAVVRPRTSDRTKHVASQNPGPNIRHGLRRKLVIESATAALHAVHLAPGSSLKEPLE